MAKKILLVEDDWKLRRIAGDFLKAHGYEVLEAEDGERALEVYYSEKVDLAILDIMLPKMDGWEVCREIRIENTELPVIMLTAKGEEEDVLKGYELEADEYITKPVSLKVLMAKVKALLRRNGAVEVMTFEDLTIDNTSHSVRLNEVEIELSSKEYELLYYMASNKGIALSREKIITALWGYDYDGDVRAVDSQIKRIRKKLEGRFIHTVRGVGYKFEVQS
ncbi:DNA-binding response regulator [Propionigenium maris DSM 9537]|uniref:DNA-binding response regulator n=1 Tax=Propionigenium maris DSM 9537 TaxID=1123000 RepID=A0A9W6GQ31_9FUSO|nr:response regulator transcription factor [Propionigenium maris]GLI58091.1 DNA-binding response regulator [Propionigenium maris DSM 9537]